MMLDTVSGGVSCNESMVAVVGGEAAEKVGMRALPVGGVAGIVSRGTTVVSVQGGETGHVSHGAVVGGVAGHVSCGRVMILVVEGVAGGSEVFGTAEEMGAEIAPSVVAELTCLAHGSEMSSPLTLEITSGENCVEHSLPDTTSKHSSFSTLPLSFNCNKKKFTHLKMEV